MGYGVVILVHIINKEKAHYGNIKRAHTAMYRTIREQKSETHSRYNSVFVAPFILLLMFIVYVSWLQKFKLKYFHSDLKPGH